MANGRSDRRVSYTKMVLKNALIELMQEKHIGKITIKEICERADINRGTFYTHYTDQFDLQNQIFEDLLSRISTLMDQMPPISAIPESLTVLTCIFRFTYENRQLVKIVLGDNSTIRLQEEVLHFLLKKKILNSFPVRAELQSYLYRYIAYGCVGIVREWLESDDEESPETIAELVLQLTEHGVSSFS